MGQVKSGLIWVLRLLILLQLIEYHLDRSELPNKFD